MNKLKQKFGDTDDAYVEEEAKETANGAREIGGGHVLSFGGQRNLKAYHEEVHA